MWSVTPFFLAAPKVHHSVAVTFSRVCKLEPLSKGLGLAAVGQPIPLIQG